MAPSAAELFPRAPSTDTYEFKPRYKYKNYHDPINNDTCGKWKYNTLKDITQDVANGSIVWWIKNAVDLAMDDDELWRDFRYCFKGWTVEIFDIADKQALRNLRTFILESGVFVKTARGISLSSALAEVVISKEEHRWTPTEIEEQLQYRTKKERTTQQRREGYEERLRARERVMEEWMDEWEDYDV